MNQTNIPCKVKGQDAILTLEDMSMTFPEDPAYQDKLANLDTPPDQLSDEMIWEGFKSSPGRTLEFRDSLSPYEIERLDSMLESLRDTNSFDDGIQDRG